MTLQLILLAVLLVCSAFFSGAETALFALNRHELSRFRRHPQRSGRTVAELMRRPRRVLLTLMVGNVTLNMFIFATSLAVFQHLAGRDSPLGPILGLISPIAVTLFGEILPKGTAIVLRIEWARRTAPIVSLIQHGLTPIVFVLLHGVVLPMTRLLVGTRTREEHVAPEELAELLDMSQRHKIIDADENAMLGEVIRLGELYVRDAMVPRVDVIAFDIHDDPVKLRQLLRARRFTKVPVYNASIDEIMGLIYAKDLFLNPSREPGTLIRPVRFVPEMITLTQLLTHFRKTGTQLAIVVNELGAMVGLVTIEDVAKQIVGELEPPGDADHPPTWEQIDEGRYRVSGRISIREWAEQFRIRELNEPVTTLAGLMLARLGWLPTVGDQVRIGNLQLTVDALAGRRIEWILIELVEIRGTAEASSPTKEVAS